MYFEKINWSIRAVLSKVLYKKILLPSYIGKPIYIHSKRKISIGKNVRIYPGCRMETIDNGEIEIERNVSIAQNFHISSMKERLVIGENTTILGNVFITNIDHEYTQIGKHILEQPLIYKKTFIGENCFIGYGASIQAGTVLGKQCIVGTNAVVRGTFPDYVVLAGVPARIIKRYNKNSYEWEKINNL